MGEVLLNHGFHGWAGMGRGGPAFVSFVYFVVPSLRGVEAHLMASWRPTPAPGTDVPGPLATGLHLGVCRTTKYTKYTKRRPAAPRSRFGVEAVRGFRSWVNAHGARGLQMGSPCCPWHMWLDAVV